MTNSNGKPFREKYSAPYKISFAKKSGWLQYFKARQTKALALQEEIDRLDKEIDAGVYQIYDLAEEEIALI